MRIIAGKHRGRRLAGPSNDKIRPTTDRVRESLFSILGPFDDMVVIDAYAGTGALGCEALSRGASHVFFFDAAREAIQLVRENVQTLGEEDATTIVQAAFARGLQQIDREVDIVFLDPPYGGEQPTVALAALAACPMITAGALIVLEQDARDEVSEVEEFELDEVREFGDTRITFFYRR